MCDTTEQLIVHRIAGLVFHLETICHGYWANFTVTHRTLGQCSHHFQRWSPSFVGSQWQFQVNDT
jgi:hypothetical protein